MKIHIKKSARKELIKLPDNILIKSFKTILNLGENPYPGGYDKVEGKENQLRIWIDRNYRILYEVNKEKDRLDIVAVRLKSKNTYK